MEDAGIDRQDGLQGRGRPLVDVLHKDYSRVFIDTHAKPETDATHTLERDVRHSHSCGNRRGDR